LAKNKY